MFANFANRLGMDSDIAIAQPFTRVLTASGDSAPYPLNQCRKIVIVVTESEPKLPVSCLVQSSVDQKFASYNNRKN